MFMYLLLIKAKQGGYSTVLLFSSPSMCFTYSDLIKSILIQLMTMILKEEMMGKEFRHENVLFTALWDHCLRLTVKTLTCCWQTCPLHNHAFDKGTGHVVTFLPGPSHEVTTSAWMPGTGLTFWVCLRWRWCTQPGQVLTSGEQAVTFSLKWRWQ